MNFKEKTTYFELSNDELQILFKKNPYLYLKIFFHFRFYFQSVENNSFYFNLSDSITEHLNIYFDFKCLSLKLIFVEELEEVKEKINPFKCNNKKICFSNHYEVCIKNKTNDLICQRIVLDYNKIMKQHHEKQDLNEVFLNENEAILSYFNAIHKEIIKITSKIE